MNLDVERIRREWATTGMPGVDTALARGLLGEEYLLALCDEVDRLRGGGGPFRPREVLASLREEYEALALMSYHGTAWGGMSADIDREGIEKIRALLADAGMTIEAMLA